MRLLTWLILSGLIIVSCNDDESEPEEEQGEVTVRADFVFNHEEEEPKIDELIALDGRKSTIENAEPEYFWTLNPPPDSDAQLSFEHDEFTNFYADIAGEYEATLEITANGKSDKITKVLEIIVTITPDFVFNYENEEPRKGEIIELDGSNTTVENAEPEFFWTLNPPIDSDAELSSDDEKYTDFYADVAGNYEAILEVFADDKSAKDTKMIEVVQ